MGASLYFIARAGTVASKHIAPASNMVINFRIIFISSLGLSIIHFSLKASKKKFNYLTLFFF